MKVKALVSFAVLGLVGASVAFAAPPPGKGNPHSTTTTTAKPATTGPGCKPAIAVILKGTLTADGTATSISMHVTGGNRFARGFKTAGNANVALTPGSTKVIRGGKAAATDLKNNDVVNVQARACKADMANDATPALTAVRITAHAPSS
jgi:hypothetical protein